MPDPRPLSSFTSDSYDHPPASSNTVDVPTRLTRLRRALQHTREQARELSDIAAQERQTRRTSALFPLQSRRRQRSPSSEHDQYANNAYKPKRRRLDVEEAAAPKKAFKYGYYGQVEPGKLKLELVACDGGVHVGPGGRRNVYHGPENILRHDKSVYCSKRGMVNVMLQHHDETSFCLEQLHIVAPEEGYSCPVVEGAVYVSMSSSNLYKFMDHPQERPRPASMNELYFNQRPPRASPERLTLSDALRDPQITAALDIRQELEDEDFARRADEANDLAYYGDDFGFGRRDAGAHCDVPPFRYSPSTPPQTPNEAPAVTLVNDEDIGPEEPSTPLILQERETRARLQRRRHEIENWDREDRWMGFGHGDEERWGVAAALDELSGRIRSRHTKDAPPTRPVSVPVDSDVTTADFRIKRGKNKVTIKFDPPVSGRYILLRMESGLSLDRTERGNENVDVQAVIAKGFAGPRFFPAIRLR